MDKLSSWSGKSILVVDDSKKIQLELSASYSSLGLAVIGVANHGIEALEMYKTLKPDFVSMDIVMPMMHGFESAQKIFEIDSNANLFFVSCLAHDTNIINSFTSKIHPSRFVGKPWTMDHLKRALEACLDPTVALPASENNKKQNQIVA